MTQEKEFNLQEEEWSEEDYNDLDEMDPDFDEGDVPFEIEFHYGLYLMESSDEKCEIKGEPPYKTHKYVGGEQVLQTYSAFPIEEEYFEYKEVKKAFDYCKDNLTPDQIAKLAKGFNGKFDKSKHYMIGIFRDENEDFFPATLYDTFDLEIK